MASLHVHTGQTRGGAHPLGRGLPSYVTTHPRIGDRAQSVTLYEQAKCGLCKELLDSTASIVSLVFKSISGKANASRTAVQSVDIAIKTALGNGIHNVPLLLSTAVRP